MTKTSFIVFFTIKFLISHTSVSYSLTLTLTFPWTARRSNQSILKEISPGSSLEGLMLKLKLQYLDHLMQRVDSSEKTLGLGKIKGRRRRGRQRMRWLDGSPTRWTWIWVDSGSWWWREAWCAVVHEVTKRQTDWVTELNTNLLLFSIFWILLYCSNCKIYFDAFIMFSFKCWFLLFNNYFFCFKNS